MDKTKFTVITGTIFLILNIILSCDNNNFQDNIEIQVKYIEQICCGDLKTLKNELVESSDGIYKDSLLSVTNPNEFPLLESLQIGDIITIEYELTENSEAICEVTCNRHNGISIKILHIEN